jgi:uncharacterized protein (TIGR02246 family)
MRRIVLGLVAGLLAVAIPAAVQSQSKPGKKDPPAEAAVEKKPEAKEGGKHAADEAAIRANIAAFVKAYNAGDAKAVAALFTPDGQCEDKDGNVSEGREAVAKTFADVFKATPEKRIEVIVDEIRFIGADMAVEKGTTKEIDAPGEAPDYDRYTVVHVKRDGKWLMALARDEEGPVASAHEQLRPLAWLIGEWVDDGGSTVVRSTCRWSNDKNFLLMAYKVKVNGRDSTEITQRIGWDPVVKRIRSWVFDSEGGFGESFWTRDGNGWLIKATAVRPDGTTASATNRMVPAGRDAYVWRSMDRVVGDDIEPSIEVKIVRKPPEPKE